MLIKEQSVLRSVTLENFLSFQQSVTLPLDRQGLVAIRGVNRQSKSANSNGAGKSAIVDAIVWGLFGETFRGQKYDEVANRFSDGRCSVRVEGFQWWIERHRRPAGIELQIGADRWINSDTAGRVESLLGFGFLTFRAGAAFAQGQFARFAMASQEEQLKVLDEIQNIDFRKALERSKDWKKSLLAQQAQLSADVCSLRESIEQRRAQLESYARMLEEFQQQKAIRVAAAREHVVECESRFHRSRQDVRQAEQAEQRLPVFEGLNEKDIDFRHRIDEATADIARQTLAIDHAEASLKQREDQVEILVKKGMCPTCRQPTLKKADVWQGFRAEFLSLQESLSIARNIQARAVHTQQKLKDEYEQWLAYSAVNVGASIPVKAALEQLESIKHHVSLAPRIRATHEETEKALRRARALLKSEEQSVWTGVTDLNSTRDLLLEQETQLEEKEKVLKALTPKLAAADFWVEAFGDRGVRRYLFESIAGFITDRMRYHLAELAASEVSANLDIGLVRGREKIALDTAWSYGASAYIAASSGQDRRVDLALFAALQDFAERRTARGFPLRVYDEPSDALDDLGRELLAGWIRSQAKTVGTTLVITHSRDFEGLVDADHTWIVTLGSEGSVVEID